MSHAATSTRAVTSLYPLLKKCISPPRRFGGSTGLARVACGSLGALRPRLSPGLPFRAPSRRGCDSADLRVVRLPQKNDGAARFDPNGRFAGGPADVATESL